MATSKNEPNKPRGSSHVQSQSKLYNPQNRMTLRETIKVPNHDRSGSLFHFNMRNPRDSANPNCHLESFIGFSDFVQKYKINDDPDIKSRDPSFTGFKIPYEMICAKRYASTKRVYEAQLEHEIRQNIDFQTTAADACYFVRCMSYTTFWPPLHNMTEVKHTGKNFFQLTPKEKHHLKYIMDTDIT